MQRCNLFTRLLHPDLAVIQQSQQILATWLADMGLELKLSKTQITHTLEPFEGKVGFEFLGYNIRQHRVGKTHSQQGFKTIITPSQKAITRHYRRIRNIINQYQAGTQRELIERLNPILRGWANYYANVCSKTTFARMDHLVYCQLRAWAHRRHPHKNHQWQAHKYWLIGSGQGWIFASRTGEHSKALYRHAQTPIKRHIKVQGQRSPYDGDWVYWSQRMATFPTVKPTVAKLLAQQTGKCLHCELYFHPDDLLEVHHLDRNSSNHQWSNLGLVHRHCHDQIHRGVYDKRQAVEEPCEVTNLKHGFEDQQGGRPLC